MSKRKIIIAGKELWQLSIDQIINFVSLPGHPRFDAGPETDFWLNVRVLTAFGERETATSTELVDTYHELHKRTCSQQFDALRLGEALGFCLEAGIVERTAAGWRLIHRQRQYECVGPAKKQRAIRILNLPDAMQQRAADILWVRELKRREKQRVKVIAKVKPAIERHLRDIIRLRPQIVVEGMLVDLAFRPTDMVASSINLIRDAVDGMEEWSANKALEDLVY